MPEKRYKQGCGPSCIGCWVNNLKHGNKEAQANFKKHPELEQNAVNNVRPKQLSKLELMRINDPLRKRDQIVVKRMEYAKEGRTELAREYEQIEKDLQKELEDTKEYTVYY